MKMHDPWTKICPLNIRAIITNIATSEKHMLFMKCNIRTPNQLMKKLVKYKYRQNHASDDQIEKANSLQMILHFQGSILKTISPTMQSL